MQITILGVRSLELDTWLERCGPSSFAVGPSLRHWSKLSPLRCSVWQKFLLLATSKMTTRGPPA